jgi:hypothetical protein
MSSTGHSPIIIDGNQKGRCAAKIKTDMYRRDDDENMIN